MRRLRCASRTIWMRRKTSTVIEEAKSMRRVGKKREGAVGSTEHVLDESDDQVERCPTL